MNLGESILDILSIAYAFWNNQVQTVFSILGQSPADFKGGKPWAVVESVEPLFVGVGSSLVIIFFVVGFCSESVEIRHEIRFEAILRMLIRVCLAEFLVANHLTIAKSIFESVGALIRYLGLHSLQPLSISSDQAQVIRSLGFWESLVFMLLAIIITLVVIICSFFMLYTVYFRFLRILVITPLGALAMATASGNREVAHTALTYARHFVGVVLEGVVMVLAIMVCNTFIDGGLPEFTGNYSEWAKTLIYLCELTFGVTLTVGAVRTSQQTVSKALGL